MIPAPKMIAAVAAPFGRDLDEGLARIARHLDLARAAGARLVVLPECALGGYLREDDGLDLPPELHVDGPEIARLVALAGELTVVCGLTEAGDHGTRHSSAVVVSGDGLHGVQRKVHLPPAERFAYTPGDGFAAMDTPFGRLGVTLCYDKLFPEAARALALDGATTIACPAAWSVDRHAPARRVAADRQTLHFTTTDVARAVENQVTWVSSNLTGRWGRTRFLGHAAVVDPDGRVLARTGAREGQAVAAIDPEAAAADARARFDHLGDRRPAAYGVPAGDRIALGLPG